MRERGWGTALLWHVPAALCLRGWRSLTQPVNGSWIQLDPVGYGPFSSARHGSGSSSAQVTLFGDRADLFLVLTPSGATEGPDGAYYQVDNGPTNYFNTWAAVTTNAILNIPLGSPRQSHREGRCSVGPGKIPWRLGHLRQLLRGRRACS